MTGALSGLRSQFDTTIYQTMQKGTAPSRDALGRLFVVRTHADGSLSFIRH